MKKITITVSILLLVISLGLSAGLNDAVKSSYVLSESNNEINNENSDNRFYQIDSNGTTKPFDRIIPGTGWFCIFQMLKPFPDQMYFSLFGCINYEDGLTTIIDIDTGETIQRDGEHKVIFFNFYGPVASFNEHDVAIEGDAVFAMVIEG